MIAIPTSNQGAVGVAWLLFRANCASPSTPSASARAMIGTGAPWKLDRENGSYEVKRIESVYD
jgi:hypothetical protein